MENWSHCQMLPSTVSMKDSSSLQAGLNTRLPQRALKTAFIKGCCPFQSQPLTDSCLFLPANYKCSAASPAFPAKVLWKMIMPRMRSRKQKWWSRKYRERFCERDIWAWWNGHYVFSTAHLALHQQTLAISIEFKFDLQKSHAMLLLTMFFFIS